MVSHNTLPPQLGATPLTERISSLDFLRGIAILTILLINIEEFSYPDPWSPFKYGFKQPVDTTARFWIYFLTQGKSFSMLALLFGVGFYIFLERFEQKNSVAKGIDVYGRRLLWLFVFGAAHAYLIWDGDILHHYAACGLLIFPFRSFSSKKLLLILLVPVSILLINSYLSAQSTKDKAVHYAETVNKNPSPRTLEDDQKIRDWEKETAKGIADTSNVEVPRKNYFENIKANAAIIKIHNGRILNQGVFYRTVIMMLLGIILYRSGIFSNYRSLNNYWLITLTIFVIALVVNYARHYHWSYEYNVPVTSFLEEWLYTFPKELLGLGYVLFFNGIYQVFFKSNKMLWIANVGRTALSNYILQSILCGFIFYGYGLCYFNQFSRFDLLKIVALIWLFQIVLTWLWLRKFQYGPLEWLWRKLTYGSFL